MLAKHPRGFGSSQTLLALGLGLSLCNSDGPTSEGAPIGSTFVEKLSGIELVHIPSGSFRMGSPSSETGRGDDERAHGVIIGRAFYLGRYEVTQDEWRRVTGTSPSHFASCGGRCPVERVTFVEIERFLARLNADDPSHDYRLPSEAEWEYACRAGTVTPFNTGAQLDRKSVV